MKKLLFGTVLLALISVFPINTMAAVDIHIGFPLPPPILFPAPPAVIVLPDTDDVYVAPDMDVDLFFWNGWWWRPWEGRWYRSHYYDRGWAYYDYVPRFYFDVDPGWRGYYRDRHWHGHWWNFERIPDRRLEQNWKGWHDNRHWERQGTWGVQGYHPRPQPQRQQLRHERQQQYQQRPEVQHHQQQRQEQQRYQQQRQPQVQKPQGQPQRGPQVRQPQQPQRQPQVQQPQRQQRPQQQRSQPQGQQHQGGSQPPQSHGKPQGGGEEHRK